MLNKLLPNLILFVILTTLTVSNVNAESDFSDIENDSWYSTHVNELADMGIVDGFPDGKFRPEDILNGDQFIKMVVTALDENPGNGTKYWASPYIEYAVEIGLLDDNKIINYKKPLPRGEIACILSKALNILNKNIKIDACGLYDLYGYTPYYYVPSVLKTHNAGIMIGYPDRTFRYEKYINRAEACAVIHKLVTPINRREHQITSLTPVPVCYSYIKEEFQNTINKYEGCKGFFVLRGMISGTNNSLDTVFNPDINQNITESIKLMLDIITWPVFEFIPLAQNNMVRLDCFSDKKFSHNNMYSMFTLKYFDAPTGYPEKQWGYDTMFMKLEINCLSDEGMLNTESGLPDVYYEYKIKALMRLLFGIEKGDIFSQYILGKYIQYADYDSGSIPTATELLSVGDTKMVFFSEGDGRQLCFTFSED